MPKTPGTVDHFLTEARQVAVIANTRTLEVEAANLALLDVVDRLVVAYATATGLSEPVVRVQFGIEAS